MSHGYMPPCGGAGLARVVSGVHPWAYHHMLGQAIPAGRASAPLRPPRCRTHRPPHRPLGGGSPSLPARIPCAHAFITAALDAGRPAVLIASGAIGDCCALLTAAGNGDREVPGDGGALAGGGPH